MLCTILVNCCHIRPGQMLKRALLGTFDITTLLFVHILQQPFLQQLSHCVSSGTSTPKCANRSVRDHFMKAGAISRNSVPRAKHVQSQLYEGERWEEKGCKTLVVTERTSHTLICLPEVGTFRQSAIYILKEQNMEIVQAVL